MLTAICYKTYIVEQSRFWGKYEITIKTEELHNVVSKFLVSKEQNSEDMKRIVDGYVVAAGRTWDRIEEEYRNAEKL